MAEEGESQGTSRMEPCREGPVEPERRGRSGDRGAALTLPARRLDPEELVQPTRELVGLVGSLADDLQLDRACPLESAASSAQLAHEVSAARLEISSPVAVGLDERTPLQHPLEHVPPTASRVPCQQVTRRARCGDEGEREP